MCGSLRHLMEAVLAWGETLTFKGIKDAGLPPDVSHSLDEYLSGRRSCSWFSRSGMNVKRTRASRPVRSLCWKASTRLDDQTERG